MSPIRESERHRYPENWVEIRGKVLKRADGRCEFRLVDGSRCNAPDLEVILRHRQNPEVWRYPNGNDLGERDAEYYGVKVVLTVAHLDHTPEHCDLSNLRAGCQLHHLRHDARHHQANARETRRAKKGNLDLFSEATPS